MLRHWALLWAAGSALAVAAVALRLLVELWLRPLTWDLPGWLGVSGLVGATLLAASIPVGLMAGRLRGEPPPSTFALAPGPWPGGWSAGPGFIVLPTPWVAVLALGYLSVGVGVLPFTPDGDGLTTGPGTWLGLLALMAPLAGLVAWMTTRGPQVALTPDGVVLRPALAARERVIAWDDIDLSWASGLRTRRLPLAADSRAGVVPLSWLWVDPTFLAVALRHYATHPAERDSIGSDAGLRRLHAALARPIVDAIPRQRAADSEETTPA
ncbi:hypothetical protein GCM10010201_18560 [Pilimelia columellifera subsp. columellifera]|uniref:PH domain-containing protein n=2 Tax=Pilimelia TaxID=53370 RepID=A0ABN3NI45_9ACTN